MILNERSKEIDKGRHERQLMLQTVARLRRSAGTVLLCMNRPASAIQDVGQGQAGVGVNRRFLDQSTAR